MKPIERDRLLERLDERSLNLDKQLFGPNNTGYIPRILNHLQELNGSVRHHQVEIAELKATRGTVKTSTILKILGAVMGSAASGSGITVGILNALGAL